MNKSVVRGRRPGKPDTRQQILDVAKPRFLAEGYQAVSLRSIADAAGVDVALISYFFGSKRGLFGAVLDLAVNPTEVFTQILKGDLHTLPQRALRTVITVWDDPELGGSLRVMMRATATDPAIATLVREGIEREMIERLAERIGGRQARRRAGAFTAAMGGLIYLRYILEAEPITSMTIDELVRLYAPLLATVLGLTEPTAQRSVRPSRSMH
jgi:AcrR family transcriptional regulator